MYFPLLQPVFVFQGCIPLQGCQVNELTANPDEPGRHLFEIVPGEICSHPTTRTLIHTHRESAQILVAVPH